MAESNIAIRDIHIIGPETRERIVTPALCPALSTYDIILAGTTDVQDNFHFRRQCPDMYQILACVGGQGEVMIANVWQPCPEGSAYVTPPHQPHAYRSVGNHPWKLVWVMYDDLRRETPTVGFHAPCLIQGDFRSLDAIISQLHGETMATANAGIMFNLAALVHGYAQRLLMPPTRLAPVWDALRADLSAQWTIGDMASMACTSTEHLRRLSYSETGSSPLRYLTHLRMREACALLASSSYTLSQVAERIGYDNVFAFSTAFKRCIGVAPSEYRTRGTSMRLPSGA